MSEAFRGDVCRVVGAGLLATIIAGCVSIPEKVKLDPPGSSVRSATVDLRDARSPAVPARNASADGAIVHFDFGDAQFEPSLVTVLRARLAAEAGDLLVGKTIVVNEMWVRFSQLGRPMPTAAGPVPSPPGSSVGTNIAGGILAGIFIGGIESARATKYVQCRIEATIDGTAVAGRGVKDVGASDLEEGARVAVRLAVSDLVKDLKEKLPAPIQRSSTQEPGAVK